MEKVLISSCLLGNNVRYYGGCLSLTEYDSGWLLANVELVSFCPEVSGGLDIPRVPAEIVAGGGSDVLACTAYVLGKNGMDMTKAFLTGSSNALEVCRKQQIKYAILAEASPSCGSESIYDGTFSSNRIKGMGVTAVLLRQEGITVFSQHTIARLREALESGVVQ